MRFSRGTWCHTFRNPLEGGKVLHRSLETPDESIARLIMDDIRLICKQRDLLVKPNGDELRKYERRAVECVFGKERTTELLKDLSGFAGETVKRLDEVQEEAFNRALAIEEKRFHAGPIPTKEAIAKAKKKDPYEADVLASEAAANRALKAMATDEALRKMTIETPAALGKRMQDDPPKAMAEMQKRIDELSSALKTTRRALDLSDGELKAARRPSRSWTYSVIEVPPLRCRAIFPMWVYE